MITEWIEVHQEPEIIQYRAAMSELTDVINSLKLLLFILLIKYI